MGSSVKRHLAGLFATAQELSHFRRFLKVFRAFPKSGTLCTRASLLRCGADRAHGSWMFCACPKKLVISAIKDGAKCLL